MDDQLDSDRENDRRLRERIDPLVGELTPIGKIELATRLFGESLIDGVTQRRRQGSRVIEGAPVRVVRMLPPVKKEGEREEAPGRSGSPHGHVDDAIGHDTEEAPNGTEG